MLTEKAAYERQWGWIPRLATITSNKRVSEGYFGSTSVSDNFFEHLQRVVRVSVLIHENAAEIELAMMGPNSELGRDLLAVAGALTRIQDMVERSAGEIKTLARAGSNDLE